MSSLSFASTIKNSKFLSSLLKPIANGYIGAAGYRKLGLRYDDLLIEENDTVQEALRRLAVQSPKESYDRAYRLRVATQYSLMHQELPRDKWTKPEDDIRYLTPIIDQVKVEEAERIAFNNIIISRK